MIEDIQDKPERAAKEEVLSFRAPGRILPFTREDIAAEFEEMRRHLSGLMTAEKVELVAHESGTHLLKMVTARAATGQNAMRFEPAGSNLPGKALPSLNAADIPYAKVVHRPLEIAGHATQTLYEHLAIPNEVSQTVRSAFSDVFGADVLASLEATVAKGPGEITMLPSTNCPIVFLPRPGGGDIQATPVSPAEAYQGMRVVTDPFFQKAPKGEDAPRPRRGSRSRQTISAKPQNICGAIGGPRIRFHARFPESLGRFAAALYRYIKGGRFPEMRNDYVAEAVLSYADALHREATYSDPNTKAALDRRADRLIATARDFVRETLEEARDQYLNAELAPPPGPGAILLRHYWGNDYDRVRAALTSHHFRGRIDKTEHLA